MSRTCLRIPDFLDFHKGQMAFVIGAGPSLHYQNLEQLKNYVTITVNSGIIKKPNCDYFVTDDVAAKDWNWYHTIAKNSNCKKLLFEGKLKEHADIFDSDHVVWFNHVEGHNPDFDIHNHEGYEMSKSGDCKIVAARTSAGSAIHIAHIMGCDPIVLLGCDACYRGRKRYFWQFPGETPAFRTSTSDPVFSRPNAGSLNGKPVDQHCREFVEYWDRFAYANQNKVNIINCSNGILESFPSMSLEKVLYHYHVRKKISR